MTLWSPLKMPCALAAVKITKANSPPIENHRHSAARRFSFLSAKEASQRIQHQTFNTTRDDINCDKYYEWVSPINLEVYRHPHRDVKNRPSSKPWMGQSRFSSCRYSLSASTPRQEYPMPSTNQSAVWWRQYQSPITALQPWTTHWTPLMTTSK